MSVLSPTEGRNDHLGRAYLRASTEEQHTSPRAQRDAIDAWAKKDGAIVVAVHEDLGVSGGAELDRRPGLLAALDSVRAHRAKILVVAKRDRLARDVMIAAMVERLVEREKAQIVSADGAGNGDGPEALLMRSIINAFSMYERALIRARTRAALAAKKRRGEVVGTVAYGYRRTGALVVADEREQEIVRVVGELRAAGLSLREIAAELTGRGFTTRRGGRWFPETVRSILATAPYGVTSSTVQ